MKKIIVIIILLLLAGVGTLYFSSGRVSLTRPAPKSTPVATITPENESIVVYSSSGFSPLTLTVSSGTTVTFLNNSNMDMWIASAPHPIHTNFPEFDAKKGSKPGKTYTFTFTKPDTYGFHNHLNPSDTAFIEVN